jgi:hypothetical protein
MPSPGQVNGHLSGGGLLAALIPQRGDGVNPGGTRTVHDDSRPVKCGHAGRPSRVAPPPATDLESDRAAGA